jgi:amino acid transporter
MSEAARIENILVILKVLAIVLFVIVGLTDPMYAKKIIDTPA